MVELTATRAKQARSRASLWPSCVEYGLGPVKYVFFNRVRFSLSRLYSYFTERSKQYQNYKCLSHMNTARGNLVDLQDGYLHCGCPLMTSALQLWLTKMSVQVDWFNEEWAEVDSHMTAIKDSAKKDYTFSPQTLLMVEAGISSLTGLRVEQLLRPEVSRLQDTASFAMGRLGDIFDSEVLRETSKKFMEELQKLREAK